MRRVKIYPGLSKHELGDVIKPKTIKEELQEIEEARIHLPIRDEIRVKREAINFAAGIYRDLLGLFV